MSKQHGGNAGVLVRPPRLALAALGLGVAIDWWLAPLLQFPVDLGWRLLIGFLIAGTGLAIGMSAMRLFARAGTNIPTNQPSLVLVTEGPYRFSRNPIYVGLLTLYGGLAIVLGSPTALLLGVGVAMVLHFGVVKREERYLLTTFGAPYESFMKRTRRWF